MSNAKLQETLMQEENSCMAWTDYKKAIGNVSHSWIIKILEVIQINK